MPLEELLSELRNKIAFKGKTSVGDIVLVGMKPGLFFGVVLDIKPDIKKNWWNVNFKLLVIPPADVTWILRAPQMNGDIFTIGGEEHFMISLDMGLQRQTVKRLGARPVLSIVKQDAESISEDDTT
jgi:hypothetical protein